MNWTKLEREGYKPHVSLFDDGFPNVPAQDSPWPSFAGLLAFLAILLLVAIAIG